MHLQTALLSTSPELVNELHTIHLNTAVKKNINSSPEGWAAATSQTESRETQFTGTMSALMPGVHVQSIPKCQILPKEEIPLIRNFISCLYLKPHIHSLNCLNWIAIWHKSKNTMH